jgi:PhnB protein
MTTTLWPTLTVADVDASLAFYSQTLGFTRDLRLQDDSGKTFLGSVEVGDTVIMFERADPRKPKPSGGGGVVLTICFPNAHDLDGLYASVRATGALIACQIDDRFWGNRDFTVVDPDGYHIVLARPVST